jgi:hypothetical protein
MKLSIAKPLFHTFAHHTAVLSILPQNREWLPWFFRSYLQVIGFENPGGFMTMDVYTSIYTLSSCPWITLGSISREKVKQRNALIDFIVESIDKGGYLYLGVDAYYIPAYLAYRQFQLPHPVLIYGYDLEKQICFIADFFDETGFSMAEAKFDELQQAFENLRETDPFGSTINLLTVNETTNYTADLGGVKQVVSDYASSRLTADYKLNVHVPINSINSIQTGEHWLTSHPGQVWLGADSYERLLIDLQSYHSGKGLLDFRNFSTILQHKSTLASLYKYLHENALVAMDQNVEDTLRLMVKTARAAQNAIIKHIIGGYESKEWISQAEKHVRELMTTEKEILSSLLNQLDPL